MNRDGRKNQTNKTQPTTPGPVVLFGSGETSHSGRKAFEQVMRKLPTAPRVSLLETPAGFELNSTQVIGRVADFLEHHLQNYDPQPSIVHARRRGTEFSPDSDEIVRPLLEADLIFMGPGSPTYAVRQLQGSLAWHYLLARHRLGAALVLASAAVVAVSVQALPVYEIYKAGEDLHWKPGLDFFGAYGFPVVFIPHWNNNDGGDELDTSRCFMGQSRFAELCAMLPPEQTIVGIDEKTAFVLEFESGKGRVVGQGGVSLLKAEDVVEPGKGGQKVKRFLNGQEFQLSDCCPFQKPAELSYGIPQEAWEAALAAAASSPEEENGPPQNVVDLMIERQESRQQKDWAAADRLRQEILELGWIVTDTPDGPTLSPSDDSAGT